MSQSRKFAIVDIETTGGSPRQERITEIGIVLHDGTQVLDTYETLVNPERQIPEFITRLTGISNEMVAEAPRFFEIAKDIVEWTEGAIFVAHNVRFDYGFIRAEFNRLGYSYSRKRICTVKLSRQCLPGLRSYKLGNLIKHFKIPVNDRHRALEDAKATAQLLEIILAKQDSSDEIEDMIQLGLTQTKLPEGITHKQLDELPEECGVYYFHDANGKVVYVGKSKNIRKRVMTHFANQNPKGSRIHRYVRDISFEITGSELIALLYESHLIKHLRPFINRAQRQRSFPYVIFSYENVGGYRCFDIKKVSVKERADLNVICDYPRKGNAMAHLARMMDKYELCKRLCGLEKPQANCLYFQIKLCQGGCIGAEPPEQYNARANEAAEQLSVSFEKDFILLEEGRQPDEYATVLVQKGIYRGFGYVNAADADDTEYIIDSIKQYKNNAEVLRIIRHQMGKRNIKCLYL